MRSIMRRLFGSRRRKIGSFTVMALALIVTSVGVAAWLTTATNVRGNNELATLSVVSVAAGAYPAAPAGCYPGGTSCDLAARFQTSTVGLKLTGWSASAPLTAAMFTISQAGIGTCTTADLAANITIPAKTLGTPVTIVNDVDLPLAGAVVIGAAMPSGCQGAKWSLSGTTGITATFTT